MSSQMSMSTQAYIDGIGHLLFETASLPVLFVGPTLYLFALVFLLLVGLVLARIIFGLAVKIIVIAGGVILGLFLLRLLTAVVLA